MGTKLHSMTTTDSFTSSKMTIASEVSKELRYNIPQKAHNDSASMVSLKAANEQKSAHLTTRVPSRHSPENLRKSSLTTFKFEW